MAIAFGDSSVSLLWMKLFHQGLMSATERTSRESLVLAVISHKLPTGEML